MSWYHFLYAYVFYAVGYTAIINFSNKVPNPPLVPISVYALFSVVALSLLYDAAKYWLKKKFEEETY